MNRSNRAGGSDQWASHANRWSGRRSMYYTVPKRTPKFYSKMIVEKNQLTRVRRCIELAFSSAADSRCSTSSTYLSASRANCATTGSVCLKRRSSLRTHDSSSESMPMMPIWFKCQPHHSFRRPAKNFELTDKSFVSRFLKDAQQILETAGSASDPDLAILIHEREGIRVVCGKGDWPIESLLRESGASAAYRVSRSHGRLVVEGASGSETCLLQRSSQKRAAPRLADERPAYEIVGGQWGREAKILFT